MQPNRPLLPGLTWAPRILGQNALRCPIRLDHTHLRALAANQLDTRTHSACPSVWTAHACRSGSEPPRRGCLALAADLDAHRPGHARILAQPVLTGRRRGIAVGTRGTSHGRARISHTLARPATLTSGALHRRATPHASSVVTILARSTCTPRQGSGSHCRCGRSAQSDSRVSSNPDTDRFGM